jgi:hypothetical protein
MKTMEWGSETQETNRMKKDVFNSGLNENVDFNKLAFNFITILRKIANFYLKSWKCTKILYIFR